MASAPEIIEIGFDDLVQYLNQFYPGSCDFCGAKMWTIHTNENKVASVVEPNVNLKPKEGGRVLALGGGAQVIQIQCRRCGQVKYFFAQHVIENLHKNMVSNAVIGGNQ